MFILYLGQKCKNYTIMKRFLLSVMCVLFAGMVMAQLEVRSDGSVVFPGKVKVNTAGNLLLPGDKDIRLGGDTLGTNHKWGIEYFGGGLNFWKPSGDNSGDYKMFIADNGKVGIAYGNSPQANLHVKGFNIRLTPTNSAANIEMTAGTSDPRIRTGSSKIVLYKMDNTGYANIECANVSNSSDSTLKANIKRIDENALANVCKLNGYTYNWKADAKKELNSGFIAQEVEKIFPHLVSSTDDTTHIKTMNYIGLMPYLVEAIKDQQKQIEILRKELAEATMALQSQSATSMLKSYQIEENKSKEVAFLSQNKPNPFSANTTINMVIPESVTSAMLYVYDLQGKQIKALTVTGRGATSETIYGHELQAGLYIYSLVTDGKLIGSKQMILTE